MVVAGAVVVALGSAAFTITGDTCHSLAPGKTCSVTVRFTPAGSGTVTATLTAAGKKTVTVADVLTGSGKGLGEVLGNIYWADAGDSTVNSAALDGSNPQAIVNGQDDPIGVAVDSGHLYWANNDISGTINEAPLTGGPVTTLVTGQPSPVGVAVSP